jgi:hypothetical protein
LALCKDGGRRRVVVYLGLVTTKNITIDLGNNESMSRGVFPTPDGRFLALTFTQSKTFKTLKGAEKWLARKTPAR